MKLKLMIINNKNFLIIVDAQHLQVLRVNRTIVPLEILDLQLRIQKNFYCKEVILQEFSLLYIKNNH